MVGSENPSDPVVTSDPSGAHIYPGRTLPCLTGRRLPFGDRIETTAAAAPVVRLSNKPEQHSSGRRPWKRVAWLSF